MGGSNHASTRLGCSCSHCPVVKPNDGVEGADFWLRGVDLNHRPLGYEPISGATRGNSAQLTTSIFSKRVSQSRAPPRLDGHNFGHNLAPDIATRFFGFVGRDWGRMGAGVGRERRGPNFVKGRWMESARYSSRSCWNPSDCGLLAKSRCVHFETLQDPRVSQRLH